jgi:hypothetical protein
MANQQRRDRAGNAAFAIFRPGKFMESKAAGKQADQDRADAERFRQEAMDLSKQLSWEPDYVSDIMPNYQRAQSPLARSYLESMLTGANASSIPSTRPGAQQLRAGAQGQFDQQFGGWEQLLERQRAAERAMPWAPGKFSAPAVMPLGGRYVGPRLGGELPRATSAPGWGAVAGEAGPRPVSGQDLLDRARRR